MATLEPNTLSATHPLVNPAGPENAAAVSVSPATSPAGLAVKLNTDNSGNLKCAVTGAGSGGTSSVDEAAFTAGTSAGTPAMGVITPSDTPSSGDLAVVALDGSRNLCVNVKAGSGSGLSVVDEASWTAGTSPFAPSGGVYNDSATALTSGQQGAERLTPNRAAHANIRNNSGTELATLSNPVRIDPTGTTTQPVSAASLPLPTGAAKEAGGNLATVAANTGNIPAQGQALAAASLPVVLTALQVTALTPPAAITNYAEETGGNLATIAGAVSSSKMQDNIAQLAGTAIAVNAGTSSAGTARVTQASAAVLNVGQISVGATATLILAANANRIRLIVTVQGATAIYYGGSGVTTSTGDGIPAIAGFPWSTRFEGAVYGIVASGSVTVTYREESSA